MDMRDGLKLVQRPGEIPEEDKNTVFRKVDSLTVMQRSSDENTVFKKVDSKRRVHRKFDETACEMLKSMLDSDCQSESTPPSKVKQLMKKRLDSENSIWEDKNQTTSMVCVRTQPLIDIISVTLRNECDFPTHSAGGAWKIYGRIYVHNYKSMHTIFKREPSDPEINSFDSGALSLSSYVLLMQNPVFNFYIKGLFSTRIRGSAPLVSTTDADQQEHKFEETHRITVTDSGCSAEVECLSLTFGVLGCVEIQLCEKKVLSNEEDQGEGKYFDVYGKIHATYNLQCKEEVHRITLFEVKKNASNKVKMGSCINLSRSEVGVPGYSPLTIHVELWDPATSELIVKGSCVFQTFNSLEQVEKISGANSVDAEVTVYWSEPFSLDEPSAIRDEFPGWKYVRIPPSQVSVAVCPGVEVFSVIISRQNEKELSLYGMISFVGGNGPFILFDRDKTDPFTLSSGCKKLPLEGFDRALVAGDSFYISVDLEDVNGPFSIKGFVVPSYGIRECKRAWYDRLLCTVVKGADFNTFAAVHYTVFSHTVQATLKIRFLFKGVQSSSASCKIHGSIVADYDKYGHKSAYEKLYFRGDIFARTKDNPLKKPCEDFDMKLSRSAVGVPSNSAMRIAVDLSCKLNDTTRFIRNKKYFSIGDGSDGVTIAGDEVSINITINWSRPSMSRIM